MIEPRPGPATDPPTRLGRARGGVVTPQMMKEVLGNFGTGVTVVTASSPSGPLGFTCQTFVSLSLDPPLISFCPARTSQTWPAIREIGRFTVNILADAHGGLSDNFARPGGPMVDKFGGIAFGTSPSGGPLLSGALAWVDCTLHAEYDGGDHTIVVANVLDLDAAPDGEPLLFFRGDYRV